MMLERGHDQDGELMPRRALVGFQLLFELALQLRGEHVGSIVNAVIGERRHVESARHPDPEQHEQQRDERQQARHAAPPWQRAATQTPAGERHRAGRQRQNATSGALSAPGVVAVNVVRSVLPRILAPMLVGNFSTVWL
jgi:hypothetical protein